MKMSDAYLNRQLAIAQKLLWGGSETENIAAHNIIAKLMKDLGVDELPDDVLESYQGEE
jgi:ribonuclease HII